MPTPVSALAPPSPALHAPRVVVRGDQLRRLRPIAWPRRVNAGGAGRSPGRPRRPSLRRPAAADIAAIFASRWAVRTARFTLRCERSTACEVRYFRPGLPSVSAAASSRPPSRPRFFRNWVCCAARCSFGTRPERVTGERGRDQVGREGRGGRPGQMAGGQQQTGHHVGAGLEPHQGARVARQAGIDLLDQRADPVGHPAGGLALESGLSSTLMPLETKIAESMTRAAVRTGFIRLCIPAAEGLSAHPTRVGSGP